MTETDFERGFARGKALGIAEALNVMGSFGASLVPSQTAVRTSDNANDEPLTMANIAKALNGYDVAGLAILRPFCAAETLNVKQAARIAGCSPRTVAQWCEKYRIGRLRVGTLLVSHPALLMLIEDDPFALAALLSGRRDDPAVVPYMRRAGLPVAA